MKAIRKAGLKQLEVDEYTEVEPLKKENISRYFIINY